MVIVKKTIMILTDFGAILQIKNNVSLKDYK